MTELEAFGRGETGYEAARRRTVANGRLPDASPARILRPQTAADVVRALTLARREGLGVSVCSGGHSWSGAHLRDDVLLLDLSCLRELTIDSEAMSAAAQPGLRSSELAAALAPHDLFFPTGHCTGPGLGGYLLQGGFGWNSRVVGPACMSVEAIDVVTAEGEVVRADHDQNQDLLWAARGAGPFFPGVVTQFHLRLQRRPPACLFSVDLYPMSLLEEVMSWVHAVGPETPRTMELMVFLRRDLFGPRDPAVMVAGPVLAASVDQARRDLGLLETCPVYDRRLDADTPQYAPTDVGELVAGNDDFYPEGWRYTADNMWTHAPIDELLPGLRRIADTLPSSPSHLMWMNWGEPEPERPDMCFSSEDLTYVAAYGISSDPAQDQPNLRWVTEHMRALEPLSTGIQLADENLARRPARFLAPERLDRLREIRARRDSDGLFRSLSLPDPA